jgi:hypothetical protein
MSQAFKFCVIVIIAMSGNRALAQCFLCSDGNKNLASGFEALNVNTTGVQNTAIGSQALYLNTAGVNNVALGYQALYSNTSGNYNTAVGTYALVSTTTATGNNAQGYSALFNTTTGSVNTAQGFQALFNNTTGGHNVGIGYQAGYYLTTGNYNIDIANYGVAGDDTTIRIGIQGAQTRTYIAGVSNAQITGSAVYVNSSGQFGILASSERYKTDIEPIDNRGEKLQQLRAVSFHLKTDPNGALQYGLIAEEVNKVYPELVIRDETGGIQGVRYDELAPMLLNEVQRQQRLDAAQSMRVEALTAESEKQKAEIRDLRKLVDEMRVGLLKMQPKDGMVAQQR